MWGSIIGALAAALVGALIGAVATAVFKREDQLHGLRVEQFQAVKALAVEIRTEIFSEDPGYSVLWNLNSDTVSQRLESGLTKVAPHIALTEYSLLDKAVLEKWQILQIRVVNWLDTLAGVRRGLLGRETIAELQSRNESARLFLDLDGLVLSAREALLPKGNGIWKSRAVLNPETGRMEYPGELSRFGLALRKLKRGQWPRPRPPST